MSAVEVLRVAVAAGAPGTMRAKLVAEAAEIAAMACRDGATTELTALEPLLPYLLEVPPAHAARGLGLDSLLAKLLASGHRLVREFIATWLGGHFESIRAAGVPLQRLLPQVSHRLGLVRESAWLVKLLCHPAASVRVSAAALLGADDRPFPLAAFNDVTAAEAIPLVHELTGHAPLGVRCIEIMFSLALARPQALESITNVVCDDLSSQYPGRCRELLAAWSLSKTSTPRATIRRFSAAKRSIERHLAERFASHGVKVAIPEVTTISPTLEQWQHAQQRAMDRAYRTAYRSSFAAMIATNITICRGSSTSVMGGAPTPLHDFSSSHEHAFVSHVDPIGASERQFASLVWAERLRAGGGST